jgi:multisubunit Na+/H+ antiporter MnhB subunit
MVNCGLERYAAAIGLLSLVAGTAAMAWLGHTDGATGVAIGASATLLTYAALGSLALRRRAAISSGIYALPTTTTTRLGG